MCERDLLRIAAAVLDADRLSPRRSARGTRGNCALSWQRALHLQISVEDPERWTAASAKMVALLTFMTDDAWELRFDAAPRPPLQQLIPNTEIERPTEVKENERDLFAATG